MIPVVYRDPASQQATISHLRAYLNSLHRRSLELEQRLQRRQQDLDDLRCRAQEWEGWDALYQRLTNSLTERTAEVRVLHEQIERLRQAGRNNATLIEAQRLEIARLRESVAVAAS